MQDIDKSEERLASEVVHLRKRIAELEAAEAERKLTEEALRKSEAKYRTVVDISPDGIAIASNGRHVFANKSLARMFGVSDPDELIGRPIMDYIHPDYRKIVKERLKKQTNRGKTVPLIEEKMLRADGTVIDTEVAAAPLEYRGEQAVLAVIRDITERKQTEKALRESEELHRSLVDNIDLGINLIDANHNIIMVNATMGDKFNKPISEIIGKKCYQEFEKRHAVCLHCPGMRTMATGRSAEVETEGVRDDGSRFHVRLQTFPVISKGGGTSAFIEIAEDITERKHMEDALRESEEKYRSLVESSEDSIYLIDKNFNYLFINRKHLSRIGVSVDQIIGRAYGEYHSLEETKDFSRKAKKVLKTEEPLSYEYKSQRDNRYFIRTLSPVKTSKDDKPSAITVISKDITELKQAEDTLREREAFNFALFQYNPVETIIVDREGKVTGFNLAKAESGARLPVIGDMMYKDYAGRHEIDMRAELMKSIRSEKRKEFLDRKYGDKYLSITISPFAGGAIIISEDVTERKRAEKLLQHERDIFLAILQRAPYGVVFLDKEGKVILINMEFTNITGYTREDIPTLKRWFLLAYPDKKYRNTVIDILEKDIAEGTDDKKFHEAYRRSFFRTFAVVCKDGTIKETEFRPIALEDGSTIVMIADITERKRINDLLESAATEWRATFDALNDAVCLLDQMGKIRRCNNAMIKLTKKPFSDLINRTCWEVVYNTSKKPERCPFSLMVATHERQSEVILRNDRWLNISIDPLFNEKGELIGGVHIISDITERIRANEELQNSREQLRSLTAYLESVREEERTNIAREIHDELAQALTALKMDLSWMSNRLPTNQVPLIEKAHSMNDLINDTIRTVKRISAALRPGILDDLGLVAAIEWQAEEFQERTGISCRVKVIPDNLFVEKDRATVIFRIFQETLTNIARHSGATRVKVGLKMKDEKLLLKVIDNGIGITDDQIHDSKSFGLIGMRERVYPWGGLINIKGIPGKGTTVEVKMPLKKK